MLFEYISHRTAVDLRCEAYQEMCVKLGMVAGKGQLKLTSTLYDPDNILDFDCIEQATRKKGILGSNGDARDTGSHKIILLATTFKRITKIVRFFSPRQST